MARKPRAYVLDSWSIIAYLEDEPAGQKVADLIADAHENDVGLLTTVVNAGEVWYILARETAEDEADRALAEFGRLGIEFVEIDWELARQAAGFKAKHKMSYADCFAAALAKSRKAELVTGDQEFRQIEGDLQVSWL